MNIFYLQNNSHWKKLNTSGIDYTPSYFPAILAWLGACSIPCCPEDLASLGEKDILLANTEDPNAFPENVGALILFRSGEIHREAVIRGHLLFGKERIPLFAPIHDEAVTGEVLYIGEN